MFLKEFKENANQRIKKLNKLLESEFGVSVKKNFPSKAKLEKLAEHAEKTLITLRNSNKKFQLEPDYAKFLGIRDVVETMLSEGMYAESPKYMEMKDMVTASVQELMDSGYTMEEACTECMNRFRMDNRFAYDDEHVMPIVITAAKSYMEACSGMRETYEGVDSDLNDRLLAELAKECGVEVSLEGLAAIEEKLAGFAEATGKSREAVVGFLNGLEEDAVVSGIQMFGRRIGEQNKFTGARKAAIDSGKTEFEVDGKKYKVTGDTNQEELEEVEESSMFDDIVNEMINEEVDVEQAEVVMAVRSLADDIQDQIERIGRMMNEDLPAIADQMRAEMGATQAQGFVDASTQVLASYLEGARSAKAGLDTQVSQLSGEEQVGGLGDTAELGGDMEPELGMDDEMGLGGEEEPADNIPAAAGPEEEPLGRAAI